MKTNTQFYLSRSFILRMKSVSGRICSEIENTHSLFNNIFLSIICRLCDNVDKPCSTWQTADDDMAHAHFMLDN